LSRMQTRRPPRPGGSRDDATIALSRRRPGPRARALRPGGAAPREGLLPAERRRLVGGLSVRRRRPRLAAARAEAVRRALPAAGARGQRASGAEGTGQEGLRGRSLADARA